MAGVTLDSGALIAAEKNDRRFWAFWGLAMSRGIVPTVPAAALAQAWRGARSARLAQVLAWCTIEPLDETLAKRTGDLLGRSRTTDVVDASVVVGAAKRGDEILSTDPDDLGALASVMKRVGVVDMRGLPAKRSPRRKRR